MDYHTCDPEAGRVLSRVSPSDKDSSFSTRHSDLELPLPDFLLLDTAVQLSDDDEDWDDMSFITDQVAESTQQIQVDKFTRLCSSIKRFGGKHEGKFLASISMPDLKQIFGPRASREDPIFNPVSIPVISPPTEVDALISTSIPNQSIPQTSPSETDSVHALDFPIPPRLSPTQLLKAQFMAQKGYNMTSRNSEVISDPALCASSHPVGLRHVQAVPRTVPPVEPGPIIYTTGPRRLPSVDAIHPPWNHTVHPIFVDPITYSSHHSPTTSTSSTSSPSTLWNSLGSRPENYSRMTPLAQFPSSRNCLQLPNKTPPLYRAASNRSRIYTRRPGHEKMDSGGMVSFMDMPPDPKKRGAVKMAHKMFLKFARKVKGDRIWVGTEGC